MWYRRYLNLRHSSPNRWHVLKVFSYLVGAEPDDGGVGQDGDEHLGLKEQVSAGHFERSGEPSQTSGQGVEHLIENHLTCAVILDIADTITTQPSDKQSSNTAKHQP